MEKNGFSLLVVPRGNEARGVREFRLSGTGIISMLAGVLFLGIVFTAMAVTYGSSLVDQVGYLRLQRENQVLRTQLDEMNQAVVNISAQMDVVAERDEVLRLMAEMDPLADEIRQAGVGGSYRDFDSELLLITGSTGALARDTQSRLSQLSREMKLEIESLLDIDARFSESETFLLGWPSITPIDRALYRTRMSSAFSIRDDPLEPSRRRFHAGNDWAAAQGTPVRATADGIVIAWHDGDAPGYLYGFGNYVRLEHASGLQTFYGHFESLHPRVKGSGSVKRVKRGDVIGYVGKTGRSQGYHLHYAVIKDGREVNPWHFYYDDRTDQALGIRK
ncbi:M23 family metallopeptidase [Candidatus Zixiibacteriota bacterium]